MPSKPVSFQGNDLKEIGAGDLDPSTLPATIVTTDGLHPFTAPQPGVAPVVDADLTTRQYVRQNTGAIAWQGMVLDQVAVLPGSPAVGDRYILTTDQSINQWSGSVWETVLPFDGWTTFDLTLNHFCVYMGPAWVDWSVTVDHEALINLLGGDITGYYHLTNPQYTKLTTSQAARMVLAAPTGAPGIPDWRLLEAADIQSGSLAAARGGLGLDASAAAGYAKWTAGVPSFSASIPFTDITGTPVTFTPGLHASTHGSGGSDELALDAAQITTGLLSRSRGGTGASGASLPARYALMSGTTPSTPVAYRLITPDDISGATAAGQVLQRNLANTANIWGALDLTGSNAVINTRLLTAIGYLTGGGDLTADRTFAWSGVDVMEAGVLIGRRPILNFVTGLSVVEDALNNKIDISATVTGAITSLTAGNNKVFYSDGSGVIIELPLGALGTVLTSQGATAAPTFSAAPGGGETNTASNVGAGGVGPFKQKTGVNLEFRNINAASNKVTVVLDTPNNEIDIDVVPANLGLVSDWQYVILSDGGAGHTHVVALTQAEALTVIGGTPVIKASSTTAAHAHNVTWTLVGDHVVVTAVQTVGHTHPSTAANLAADIDTGEVNTASNVGTGGVGVFKQKTGVNLEFKKINAGSNKVTITDDTGNNEVDIDVNEANLSVMVGDTGSGGVKGQVPAPATGDATKVLYGDGTWQTPPGAAGGEANTASNVGTGGVGVFKQKVAQDLQFKNIAAASAKVTVTNNVGNNTVDVDVVPAEIANDSNLIIAMQIFG